MLVKGLLLFFTTSTWAIVMLTLILTKLLDSQLVAGNGYGARYQGTDVHLWVFQLVGPWVMLF